MESERRRSPAEARRFWELAIDLWSSSGLSVADFCGREGLKDKKPSLYPEVLSPRPSIPEGDTIPIE